MDEWDAYFWPNSTVLKNKTGLTHTASLRSFEYEATRQRAEQLRDHPLVGHFDTTQGRENSRRHCCRRLFEGIEEGGIR